MDISTGAWGADDADEEDADDVDVGAGREQKAASAVSTMAFTNALLLLVRMKHRIRGHLKHGAAVKLNAGVLVVVALLHSVSARAGCNGTTFAKVDLLQLVRAQERARGADLPELGLASLRAFSFCSCETFTIPSQDPCTRDHNRPPPGRLKRIFTLFT